MDNILKAIIKVDAPGVEQAFKIVSIGVTTAERGLTNLQKALIQTGGGVKTFTNSFTGLIPPLKNIPAGIENTNRALIKLPNVANQATMSMVNLGRVVQDAPFGFLGIANNLNPLLESFQRLRATTGSNASALKALGASLMGAGGLGFALSIVSTGLILFGDKIFGIGKKTNDAAEAAKKYKEAIQGIFSEVAKEATQAASLVAVLKSETETRERKLQAIKELQRIQPEIFAGLKLEGETVIGLDSAYQNYINNLSTVIAVKLKQLQLEQLITKQLINQGAALTQTQKDFIKSLNFQKTEVTETGKVIPLLADINAKKDRQNKLDKESAALANDIAAIIKDISELSKGVKLPDFKEPKINTEKIKKFIRDFGSEAELIIAPKLKFDFDAGAASESFSKQFKPVSDELQKVVDRQTKNNPIRIESKLVIDTGKQAAADLQSNWENLAKILTDTVAPAFTGVFEAILRGEDPLKAFFKSVIDSVNQLITRLISAAIQAAILSALSGGTSSFASIFGKILGFRAHGGPVMAGGSYIVGEDGPELFVPNTGGSIIPNTGLNGRSIAGDGTFITGELLLQGYVLKAALSATERRQGRLG